MKKGFTLSEALITMTMIGIVAALTVPVLSVNVQNAQYKAGLKKAVRVLNEAISMNVAMGKKTPLTNEHLYQYLMQTSGVLKSTTKAATNANRGIFYTIDGMRYEMPAQTYSGGGSFKDLTNHAHFYTSTLKLSNTVLENGSYTKKTYNYLLSDYEKKYGNCGTKGTDLKSNNTDSSDNWPCVVLVDVDGDKRTKLSSSYSTIKVTSADKVLNDLYILLVTDVGVIPYGTVAQNAYYYD